jgi:hypothetical protein
MQKPWWWWLLLLLLMLLLSLFIFLIAFYFNLTIKKMFSRKTMNLKIPTIPCELPLNKGINFITITTLTNEQPITIYPL